MTRENLATYKRTVKLNQGSSSRMWKQDVTYHKLKNQYDITV
jgi:hypothetical protein